MDNFVTKGKQIFCFAYCAKKDSVGEKSCEHCEMNPNYENHFELSEEARDLIVQEVLADGRTVLSRLENSRAEQMLDRLQIEPPNKSTY